MKRCVFLLMAILVLLSPVIGGCGQEDYSLTIAVSGEGTTIPGTGTYTCDKGEEVTVTATPFADWKLDHWSGDASGTTASIAIAMDSDKTVIANFSKITYTLTMAISGTGTIDPAAGPHTYDTGTVVNITATADDGWHFVNWSGDVAAPLSANTTVPMDSDKVVTAHFVGVWTGNEVAQTAYGAVRAFEDEANTWVWKAIPYAKPPVGELRWKAPQNPNPWGTVREETKFCSPCAQYSSLDASSVVGSEDCLYLNVWRPQSWETALPVYVWIHRGGNSIGSATQVPTYYGANLASRSNMVFVSVNYRLGPLGWFTHPALRSSESGCQADDSGNYGTFRH